MDGKKQSLVITQKQDGRHWFFLFGWHFTGRKKKQLILSFLFFFLSFFFLFFLFCFVLVLFLFFFFFLFLFFLRLVKVVRRRFSFAFFGFFSLFSFRLSIVIVLLLLLGASYFCTKVGGLLSGLFSYNGRFRFTARGREVSSLNTGTHCLERKRRFGKAPPAALAFI